MHGVFFVVLSTDNPFFHFSPVFVLPTFRVMDLESKAEHIRDMLSNHAPEDQRRILHDLLNAVPAQQEPSIANSEDYLRIFRHLLFPRYISSCRQPPITLEQRHCVPPSCTALGPGAVSR